MTWHLEEIQACFRHHESQYARPGEGGANLFGHLDLKFTATELHAIEELRCSVRSTRVLILDQSIVIVIALDTMGHLEHQGTGS